MHYQLDRPIFSVYLDPTGDGYLAISDANPRFCFSAATLSELGGKVEKALKFYEDDGA